MQEKLNLVQKLAKIRSMSDAVAKSKRGYNYSYEDITEILANVTAGMKRYSELTAAYNCANRNALNNASCIWRHRANICKLLHT